MWKLAIDLGSSMTKIYRADTSSGIVLSEPSCVAISQSDGEIRAIGKEAKNLIGKTAEYTTILYPVYEGEITHLRLAAEMLRAFLTRVGLRASALRRAQILFSVPCGASEEVRANYAFLAEECGLYNAVFVEQPYLAAVGAGATLEDSDPVFCLDIGGGVTNAAVVSPDGIVAGVSMNIGGNNMDEAILSHVERVNRLHIGMLTAERLKQEIGSLSVQARGAFIAEGSSVDTHRPASSSVQAQEVQGCIRAYLDKILEYAGAVLKKLPAEVAATVNRNGVYLSGGIMKIPGVPQYIGNRLEMRYHLPEEPQYLTVLGGGEVISNRGLYRRFTNG